MRTQIEADLLLQNLMLTADAMGLGAWIHASIAPPVLLGDPKFRKRYGPMLGFDWTTPRWKPLDLLRWHVPLPKYANLRATAVGLRHKGEHLIKAMCPPNYDTHGRRGRRRGRRQVRPGRHLHRRGAVRAHLPRASSAPQYLEEASDYAADVIACTRDICTYIYETHGRFPAHCDTIHVPGVWLQTHHVENAYYEKYFRNGLTDAHQLHDERWH